MHEIVIVISDLYLPDTPAVAPVALPGLDRIARFGQRLTLDRGWREWLARWIGRHDLEQAPVSAIAGAARADAATRVDAATSRADTGATWMATPLHLAAGLTTLHFDARGILRLSPEELDELALDFGRTFHDARLMPLQSGEFLLLQSVTPAATTTEPARIAGGNVADALPRGAGAATLRRLGAEIEMWLHEHPVNVARGSRGELPISTLWIWGGGARMAQRSTSGAALPRAFGYDSYLQGLWRLCGEEAQPLPQQLDATYAAGSVVLVVAAAGRMSRANTSWSIADESMAELLAAVDRRFVAPAVEHLQRRSVERVSILANDRLLVLSSGSQRKFWRRARPALERLR